MNNNQHKNEYSEETIHQFLKKESEAIKPSEILLRSMLSKLPAKNIPSPYRSKIRVFVFNVKKISITLLALIVIVGGASLIFHGSSRPTTTAFDGQLSIIDAQMSGLNVDNAAIDQSFHQQ